MVCSILIETSSIGVEVLMTERETSFYSETFPSDRDLQPTLHQFQNTDRIVFFNAMIMFSLLLESRNINLRLNHHKLRKFINDGPSFI